MPDLSQYVGKNARVVVGPVGHEVAVDITAWHVNRPRPAPAGLPRRSSVGRESRAFYQALRDAGLAHQMREMMRGPVTVFNARWSRIAHVSLDALVEHTRKDWTPAGLKAAHAAGGCDGGAAADPDW